MRTIIRYAEQQERPLVTGPTSGLDVDRKEKFYGSHGLQKMGALFASDEMFKSEDASEDAGQSPARVGGKIVMGGIMGPKTKATPTTSTVRQ